MVAAHQLTATTRANYLSRQRYLPQLPPSAQHHNLIVCPPTRIKICHRLWAVLRGRRFYPPTKRPHRRRILPPIKQISNMLNTIMAINAAFINVALISSAVHAINGSSETELGYSATFGTTTIFRLVPLHPRSVIGTSARTLSR